MTDAETHVPRIVNQPGVAPARREIDDLVDSSDTLPTLCDAADAPVPASLNVDGGSFHPHLMVQVGHARE